MNAHDPYEERRPFPNPEHSIAPRRPRTVGGVVFLLVVAVTLLGLGLIVLDEWRTGLAVMGSALLFGAIARLLLPERQAGMLGLRRKFVDVATMAALGGMLIVMAFAVRDWPPPVAGQPPQVTLARGVV